MRPLFRRFQILFIVGVVFLLGVRFLESSLPNMKYANVFIRLGQKEEKKGHFDKAVNYYQKAVYHKPTASSAYYSLGQGYFRQGRLEKAIVNYQKAAFLNPVSYQAFHALGMAWRKKGDYSKAIDNLTQAIDLNTHHYPYWIDRGETYLMAQDAVGAYSSVLDLRHVKKNEMAERLLDEIHSRGYFPDL